MLQNLKVLVSELSEEPNLDVEYPIQQPVYEITNSANSAHVIDQNWTEKSPKEPVWLEIIVTEIA